MSHLKMWLCVTLIYLSMMSWCLNTWVAIWMAMETSVLFMMGVLSLSLNYDSSALMMKYFLVQLLISLVFLLFCLFYLFNFFYSTKLSCFIVLCAKTGLFPFHYWFIMVVGKINWLGFYMVSTFFKLPPLSLMHYMFESSMLMSVILGSAVVGSCLGLNNLSIQKVLSYSSLVHVCWLLMSLGLSIQLFWFYFFGYGATLLVLVYIMARQGIFYINQFKTSLFSSFYNFCMLFIVMSLAGFPPFIGFLLKWLLMSFLILINMKFSLLIMLMSSVFSFLFYFQLFFYYLMVFGLGNKWFHSLMLSRVTYFISFLMGSFYLFMYVGI